MDHKFLASGTDPLKCGKCKWPEVSHGPEAVCESCPNIGTMEIHGDMLLCRECIAKELATALDTAKPITPIETVNDTIKLARQIDNSVQTRTDIFNAATVSFEDIRKSINSDESIASDRKTFALAEIVKTRFNHYQKIFFEHNEIAVNAASQQRAAIQFLNTLANQLKESERKALQIADISYKPEVVKSIAPKPIKIKTPKVSMADLKSVAEKLGIGIHTVQIVMNSKNLTTAVEAIKYFEELKAKNTPKVVVETTEAKS